MPSRGKGKRRRDAIQLRASHGLLKRGKAGLAKQLPPPPNQKDGEQHVPNSLKRLMALKAGQPAPGRGRKAQEVKQQAEQSSDHQRTVTAAAQRDPAAQQSAHANGEQAAARQPSSGAAEQPAASKRVRGNKFKPSGSAVPGKITQPPSKSPAASLTEPKQLTQRQLARKQRLKERQQRKRRKRKGQSTEAGGVDSGGESAESGGEDPDALERRLLQDRNRPKFGEQAMAPLQTSLKRKHWDAGANTRLAQMFDRQMRQAKAKLGTDDAQRQEAVRAEVIEAYRQQKRGAHGGRKPLTATRQSLKALVAGKDTARHFPAAAAAVRGTS